MNLNKTTLLIIAGVTLILLLVAVWIYLLFFRPDSDINNVNEDSFSNLNLGPENDPSLVVSEEEIEGSDEEEENQVPVVDLESDPLRQLTTEPVVGYGEVRVGQNDSPYVYYMLAGTGHVHSIDLTTGEKTRVSGTTIVNVEEAFFTPDGRFVVGREGTGRENRAFVGEFSTTEESSSIFDIKDEVHEITLRGESDVLYTVRSDVGLSGYHLDLTTFEYTELFSVPLRDASVSWGASPEATHYLYPKPSAWLEGYLYKIENGQMERLDASGFGLTAMAVGDTVGVSYQVEDEYTSYLMEPSGRFLKTAITLLPEKCVGSNLQTKIVWCGYEPQNSFFSFPDNWYRGSLLMNDDLWIADGNTLRSTRLALIEFETGRNIDIIDMRINEEESNLYFKNKLDNTLWQYELPQ